MDRGVWWATVRGAPKSWTQLVTNTHIPQAQTDTHTELIATSRPGPLSSLLSSDVDAFPWQESESMPVCLELGGVMAGIGRESGQQGSLDCSLVVLSLGNLLSHCVDLKTPSIWWEPREPVASNRCLCTEIYLPCRGPGSLLSCTSCFLLSSGDSQDSWGSWCNSLELKVDGHSLWPQGPGVLSGHDLHSLGSPYMVHLHIQTSWPLAWGGCLCCCPTSQGPRLCPLPHSAGIKGLLRC